MANFPFGDDFMPQFLNDIMGMMSSSNESYLQIAEQLANSIISKESGEATANPKIRIALEPLLEIVLMHMNALLEERNWSYLISVKVSFDFVSPQIWLEKSLKELDYMLKEIADSFLKKDSDEIDANSSDLSEQLNPQDQFKNLLANIFQMTAPASLGMQIGSILGHYALNSFGSYDLSIPRNTDSIMIIAKNIENFSNEWSIEINDAAIWTFTRQLVSHLILNQPLIKSALTNLVSRHALGLRVGTEKLSEQLKNFDFSDLSTIETMFSNQETMFEIEPSLIHEQTTQELATLIALIEAMIRNISELIDEKTIGKSNLVNEAVLRYRSQFSNLLPIVETLFGYYYDEETFEMGNEFVKSLLSDTEINWLQTLFASDDNFPKADELESPEQWKLRVTPGPQL